jgi:hypothetical protein
VSNRQLDVTVGKLPPVLDDLEVTALRRPPDDFASFRARRIHRQFVDHRPRRARQPVCKVAGANRHVTTPETNPVAILNVLAQN